MILPVIILAAAGKLLSAAFNSNRTLLRLNKFKSYSLINTVLKMSLSLTNEGSKAEKENQRWVAMWKAGIAPGQAFDVESISPYLRHLLDTGKIPTGRALVPGCGRGYDVTALASSERLAIGLDLAQEAIDAANIRLSSLSDSEKPPEGKAQFICGSFFDLPSAPESKFQFIYDYTFLCALDPSIRKDWANKMGELVAPGGELLTLIYPIGEERVGGPPFKVSLELVRDLLEPVGFECIELELLPPHFCHPGRDGTNEFKSTSGTGRWRKL